MKKKILIVGPYLPGKSYGGPVKSLVNLTETLSSKYSFFVLTKDRDLNAQEPYKGVEIGEWNQVGEAQVFYAPKENYKRTITQLLKKNDFDLIYLNSFFSSYSIVIQILKLINVLDNPILLAPRGEFSPGALNLKSSKKRLFLFFYKFLKIHRTTTYTSNLKKDEDFIKNILGNDASVMIANNIVTKEKLNNRVKPYKHKGSLKIVTVSRIAKIKNLDYSLQILKKIDDNNKKIDEISFDIYGPIEDKEYWDLCSLIIKKFSERIKVNYKGTLEYGEVIEVLSAYHVFLLPTQGENFGHVIQEALLAGCPVVISDQTPWAQLKEKNVGFDISLDEENEYINILNKLIDMSEEEYRYLSKSACEYGENQIENQSSIQEHDNMFEKIINNKI